MNNISNVFSGVAQYESVFQNILVPVLVALIAGASASIASIFGNKKINDINRAKYELILENKTTKQMNELNSSFEKRFRKLLESQKETNLKIDKYTSLLKKLNIDVDLVKEMNEIKREAQRWTKKEPVLLNLLTSKANSMLSFFSSILETDYRNLTLVCFRSEMQIEIIKIKNEWNQILFENNMNKDFVEYFYNTVYTEHIDSFLNDVAYLLNPKRKINGINVEKELKETCIMFFRISCEDLLSAWDAYKVRRISDV